MFNIVLNSQNSSTFSSGNNNDLTYLFNWTNIPQRKYSVRFYWKGKNNSDFVANDAPQVFVTIGAVPNVYQASTAYTSSVSFFMGSLRAVTQSALQVYFVSDGINNNAEVFYESKPVDSRIRVQVFRDNFTTPFTTLAGSNLADYVCVLQFREIL
jgi:hypothetical protein